MLTAATVEDGASDPAGVSQVVIGELTMVVSIVGRFQRPTLLEVTVTRTWPVVTAGRPSDVSAKARTSTPSPAPADDTLSTLASLALGGE